MLGKRKKDEPTDLEKKIQFCRSYTKLWADLFSFYADKLDDASISPQQEEEFFKITSVLANRHFELTVRMGKDLQDGDKILEYLTRLTSLSSLQGLSDAEFSSTQVRWHEIFIGLNKSLGRLVAQLPQPPEAKSGRAAPAATTAA